MNILEALTHNGNIEPCPVTVHPKSKPRQSKRSAITAMCNACQYMPHLKAGETGLKINACKQSRCPLYKVRPRSDRGKQK